MWVRKKHKVDKNQFNSASAFLYWLSKNNIGNMLYDVTEIGFLGHNAMSDHDAIARNISSFQSKKFDKLSMKDKMDSTIDFVSWFIIKYGKNECCVAKMSQYYELFIDDILTVECYLESSSYVELSKDVKYWLDI